MTELVFKDTKKLMAYLHDHHDFVSDDLKSQSTHIGSNKFTVRHAHTRRTLSEAEMAYAVSVAMDSGANFKVLPAMITNVMHQYHTTEGLAGHLRVEYRHRKKEGDLPNDFAIEHAIEKLHNSVVKALPEVSQAADKETRIIG